MKGLITQLKTCRFILLLKAKAYEYETKSFVERVRYHPALRAPLERGIGSLFDSFSLEGLFCCYEATECGYETTSLVERGMPTKHGVSLVCQKELKSNLPKV